MKAPLKNVLTEMFLFLIIFALNAVPPITALSGFHENGRAEAHSSLDDPTTVPSNRGTDVGDCIGNGAYLFNGVDQYLSVPDDTLLEIGSSDFTIEARIKMDTIKCQCIIDKIDTDGGYRLELGRTGVSDICGADLVIVYKSAQDSVTEYRAVDMFSSADIGGFHYIAVAVLAGIPSVSMYLDGLPHDVIWTKNDATSVNATDVDFRIGAINTIDECFHGTIDEVRVSNVVRTASEIADYYGSGDEMSVDANTIALWHMNGDVGTAEKLDNAEGTDILDLTEVNGPVSASGFNECAVPNPPENLSGEPLYSGGELVALLLKWDPITEPGISHFSLHRDDTEDFIPDASNLLTETSDTFYYDLDWQWMPHYVYKICSNNTNTIKSDYAVLVHDDIYTGEETPSARNPVHSLLNYPNPFNPTTTIRYYLTEKCHVCLEIYDLAGKRIVRLKNNDQGSGYHQAEWDGKDMHGNTVTSGIYLYRLKAGRVILAKKMVLIR